MSEISMHNEDKWRKSDIIKSKVGIQDNININLNRKSNSQNFSDLYSHTLNVGKDDYDVLNSDNRLVLDQQFLERIKMYAQLNRQNISLKQKNKKIITDYSNHINAITLQNKNLKIRIQNYQQHIEKVFEACWQLLNSQQLANHRKVTDSRVRRGTLIRSNSQRKFSQNQNSGISFIKNGVKRLQNLLTVQYEQYMTQNKLLEEQQNNSLSSMKYNQEITLLNQQMQNLLKSNNSFSASLNELQVKYQEANSKYKEEKISLQNRIHEKNNKIADFQELVQKMENQIQQKQNQLGFLKKYNYELAKQADAIKQVNNNLQAHNKQILNKDLEKVKTINKMASELELLNKQLSLSLIVKVNSNGQKQQGLKQSQQKKVNENLTSSETIEQLEKTRNYKLIQEKYYQMKNQCAAIQDQLKNIKEKKSYDEKILQQEITAKYEEKILLLEQKIKSQKTFGSRFRLQYSQLSKQHSSLQQKLSQLQLQKQNLQIQLSIKTSQLNALSLTPFNSNPTSKQTSKGNLPVQSLVILQSKIDFLQEQLFKRIKNYHQMEKQKVQTLSENDIHYHCRIKQIQLKKNLYDFQAYVQYLQKQLHQAKIIDYNYESDLGRQPSIALQIEQNKSQDIVMNVNSKDDVENPKNSPIIRLDEGQYNWKPHNIYSKEDQQNPHSTGINYQNPRSNVYYDRQEFSAKELTSIIQQKGDDSNVRVSDQHYQSESGSKVKSSNHLSPQIKDYNNNNTQVRSNLNTQLQYSSTTADKQLNQINRSQYSVSRSLFPSHNYQYQKNSNTNSINLFSEKSENEKGNGNNFSNHRRAPAILVNGEFEHDQVIKYPEQIQEQPLYKDQFYGSNMRYYQTQLKKKNDQVDVSPNRSVANEQNKKRSFLFSGIKEKIIKQ